LLFWAVWDIWQLDLAIGSVIAGVVYHKQLPSPTDLVLTAVGWAIVLPMSLCFVLGRYISKRLEAPKENQ
jgi:hypothetical protein